MKILKKTIAQSLALLVLLGQISLPVCAVGEDKLLKAVSQGKIDDVKACLERRGLNVNYEDENGNTALTLAIQGGKNLGLIGILLRHGADPTMQMKNGIAPIDIAIENGDPEVISFILAHHDIKDPDVIYRTLCHASEKSNKLGGAYCTILEILIFEYKSKNMDAIYYAFKKAIHEGRNNLAKSILDQEAISKSDACKMATDEEETTDKMTEFLLNHGINPTEFIYTDSNGKLCSFLSIALASEHLPSIGTILSRCDSIDNTTIHNSLRSVFKHKPSAKRDEILKILISEYRRINPDALNKLFVESTTRDTYNYKIAINLLKFGRVSDTQYLDQWLCTLVHTIDDLLSVSTPHTIKHAPTEEETSQLKQLMEDHYFQICQFFENGGRAGENSVKAILDIVKTRGDLVALRLLLYYDRSAISLVQKTQLSSFARENGRQDILDLLTAAYSPNGIPLSPPHFRALPSQYPEHTVTPDIPNFSATCQPGATSPFTSLSDVGRPSGIVAPEVHFPSHIPTPYATEPTRFMPPPNQYFGRAAAPGISNFSATCQGVGEQFSSYIPTPPAAEPTRFMTPPNQYFGHAAAPGISNFSATCQGVGEQFYPYPPSPYAAEPHFGHTAAPGIPNFSATYQPSTNFRAANSLDMTYAAVLAAKSRDMDQLGILLDRRNNGEVCIDRLELIKPVLGQCGHKDLTVLRYLATRNDFMDGFCLNRAFIYAIPYNRMDIIDLLLRTCATNLNKVDNNILTDVLVCVAIASTMSDKPSYPILRSMAAVLIRNGADIETAKENIYSKKTLSLLPPANQNTVLSQLAEEGSNMAYAFLTSLPPRNYYGGC